MRGSMAVTGQISCDPGSRGSSRGSSKNTYCYPLKALCRKGFTALGSRGSSSFNFSAGFEKKEKRIREEKEKRNIYVCVYGVGFTATSATRKAESLGMTGFFGVAILNRAATRTATSATQSVIMKGGEKT